jgi:5-formyltetrahydrofolate cyclo-ligase
VRIEKRLGGLQSRRAPAEIEDCAHGTCSFEPNTRRPAIWMHWLDGLRARGATCALPVVISSQAPLVFRRWQRGAALTPGVWKIPVPAEGEDVVPDIVIAPLVGFDPDCYRLGHGGGFFDRTLASLARRPRIVGVGYARLALRTIYPQPHDIPMDVIVTEEGAVAHRP